MINFYEILGVKQTATSDEISKAYRSMMKKYHPDINKTDEAVKMSRTLNEAKEILLDDIKRREYDSKLLDIKTAKQYSRNKEETYSAKTKQYQEEYKEVYMTRWQIYIDYLKRSIDKKVIKFLKSLLVGINYMFFQIIKILILIILYIIYALEDFIEIFIGILILGGILSAALVTKTSGPDIIPFVPSNIEMFIYCEVTAVTIVLLITGLLYNSQNIYALIQNIQDKIFIKILSK